MQIMIDIPSKKYQSILAHKVEIEDDSSFIEPKYLYKAIINGTPLPKEHGRLKDVDWIDDNCENHYSDKDGSWCYTWRDIDNAPTIIDAEK